jgi:hypothetical protein
MIFSFLLRRCVIFISYRCSVCKNTAIKLTCLIGFIFVEIRDPLYDGASFIFLIFHYNFKVFDISTVEGFGAIKLKFSSKSTNL